MLDFLIKSVRNWSNIQVTDINDIYVLEQSKDNFFKPIEKCFLIKTLIKFYFIIQIHPKLEWTLTIYDKYISWLKIICFLPFSKGVESLSFGTYIAFDMTHTKRIILMYNTISKGPINVCSNFPFNMSQNTN